jgi:hypothetical protein
MAINRYESRSIKISCANEKELWDKVNKLGVAWDMRLTIERTTPEATDTNQWYNVFYFKQT